jgi:hypothetical protein
MARDHFSKGAILMARDRFPKGAILMARDRFSKGAILMARDVPTPSEGAETAPLRRWIVDLGQQGLDALPGGGRVPLDSDLFRLNVAVHAGDALQLPQLSLDGHHTVVTRDIRNLERLAVHIEASLANLYDYHRFYYTMGTAKVNT